jgi:hypothetical protein
MPDHSYAGLYYPFIHFKNDNWLKLSALYWDRMGRIVPHSYEPEDSEVVKELGGFVETLRPEWVRPEFGVNFADFVRRRSRELRQRYDIRNRGTWPQVPVWRRPPAAGGPSGTDPRLSYVFFEKMTEELREAMVDSRMAIVDEKNPRWIGMHPRLADVYMTALADQLAAERAMYPLTDETVDHLAIGSGNIDAVARALLAEAGVSESLEGDVESLAACIAIESVLPKGLEDVPVDKILNFREKYPEERHKFQRRMHEFLDMRRWLSEAHDRKVVEQRLNDEFAKQLKPELTALKEKLRDVDIDTVTGVLSAKAEVPGLAIAAATVLGLLAAPVVGALAGAALALVPVLRSRQKEQREIRRAPLAFLLRAEEELRPRQVAGWISTKASELKFIRE